MSILNKTVLDVIVLNDDDLKNIFIIWIVIALIIGVIKLAISASKEEKKQENRSSTVNRTYSENRDDNAPIKTEWAMVVQKTVIPSTEIPNLMLNTILFELKDGSRERYTIHDPLKYQEIVEGDCGNLRYQGKKFLNFWRENSK